MEIFCLEKEFPGDSIFPYDEKDLAHYLYDLYLSEKVKSVNSDLLIIDDAIEQVSISIDVNQINSKINRIPINSHPGIL